MGMSLVAGPRLAAPDDRAVQFQVKRNWAGKDIRIDCVIWVVRSPLKSINKRFRHNCDCKVYYSVLKDVLPDGWPQQDDEGSMVCHCVGDVIE
jgi:hypothetical protein